MKEVSAPELDSIKELIHEIEPNFQDFEFNAEEVMGGRFS